MQLPFAVFTEDHYYVLAEETLDLFINCAVTDGFIIIFI